MPKKEFYCPECDVSFTVQFQKGYEVAFCPFCGTDVSQDSNELDDESE